MRNLELEFSRNDCKKRNVVANLRAVRDDCGTVTLLEGTVEDITDRKRAEERIQLLPTTTRSLDCRIELFYKTGSGRLLPARNDATKR